MKEKYTKPVVETEEFKTVDVITTSSEEFPGDDNPREWGS